MLFHPTTLCTLGFQTPLASCSVACWYFGMMELSTVNHISAGFGSNLSRTMTLQRCTRSDPYSNSGLGPVLIAAGIVCRVSSLELGVLEYCVTDDKHAMAPFPLGLSLQPRTAPLSGSC